MIFSRKIYVPLRGRIKLFVHGFMIDSKQYSTKSERTSIIKRWSAINYDYYVIVPYNKRPEQRKLSVEQITYIKEHCMPESQENGIMAMAGKFKVSKSIIHRVLQNQY